MREYMELNPRANHNIRAISVAAGLLAVSLSACNPSTETSSRPTEQPIATETPNPTPTETPTPTQAPQPKPTPEDPDIALQRNLNRELVPFGMPKLELDGKVGNQTRRALCAVRLLTGQETSRDTPTSTEIRNLQKRQTFKAPLGGIVISRECQVMAVNIDNKLSMVLPVSTGKSEYRTPEGSFRVQYGRFGWHNSSLYPEERGNGNMYKPVYFNGAIAFHGSRDMYNSLTYPASHGCVRVTVSDADKLWALVGGPAKAQNDQVFKNLHSFPVHVI